MARAQYPIRLTSSELITPDTRRLIFEILQSDPFQYIPGQFINLHFEREGELLQRSYSIASIDADPKQFEIAISFVKGGRATEYLFNLQPGAELELSGPFGRLILPPEDPKRYILIATGTGVAPYRAMLHTLENRLANNPELHVELLLGVRLPADLLYAADFRAVAALQPRFHFHACCSRATEASTLSDQYIGRVLSRFDALQLNPANDIVFLCGNPDMIDSAFEYLKEHNFDSARVKREKYVFSH